MFNEPLAIHQNFILQIVQENLVIIFGDLADFNEITKFNSSKCMLMFVCEAVTEWLMF